VLSLADIQVLIRMDGTERAKANPVAQVTGGGGPILSCYSYQGYHLADVGLTESGPCVVRDGIVVPPR
jgi:hypothetical protein